MAASILNHVTQSVSWAASTIAEHFAPGTPEFYMALYPFIAYWVVAGFYELLDRSSHPAIARYRVTRKQSGKGNPVSHAHVFWRVILQQVIQTALAMIAVLLDPQQCAANPPTTLFHSAVQFFIGLFIMDTWQYWFHRAAHVNTWLYKNIHSTHHRILIPYAMGALYNHPAEALLLDTLGAGLSMYGAGMSCQLATVFFTFSTMKTVFDHCCYRWPLNPMHNLFPNCAAYHDVHHDNRGIKKNFSQPFFIHWDVLCGTYLEPELFHMTQTEVEASIKHGQAHSGLEYQQGDDLSAAVAAQPVKAVAVGSEAVKDGVEDLVDSPSTSSTVTEVPTATVAEVHLEQSAKTAASVRQRSAGVAAAGGADAHAAGVTTRSRARQAQA